MQIVKIFLYFSLLSGSFMAFAHEALNNDDEGDAYSQEQSDTFSLPALYDWTNEDLAFASGMGGGGGMGGGSMGGGGGRGWGYNPFKWASGSRRWYNPFSWGNPVAPVTTVVTPPTGNDDDLDAQIDAANRRAKKLEFLLAKQRQLKALQELNQQGGASGGNGGDSP